MRFLGSLGKVLCQSSHRSREDSTPACDLQPGIAASVTRCKIALIMLEVIQVRSSDFKSIEQIQSAIRVDTCL